MKCAAAAIFLKRHCRHSATPPKWSQGEGRYRWASASPAAVVVVVVVVVVGVVANVHGHVHVHVVAVEQQTANKPQSLRLLPPLSDSIPVTGPAVPALPLNGLVGQGQHVERIASSYVCVCVCVCAAATVDWLLFLVRELSAGTVKICISKTHTHLHARSGPVTAIVCADCCNSRPKSKSTFSPRADPSPAQSSPVRAQSRVRLGRSMNL